MSNKRYVVLFVLCLGYFIDFYDLTLLSVSYTEIFKEHFGILNQTKIQQTYYLVNNVQMLGMLFGALLFGVIADRLGRAKTIKYSILIYSLSTIISAFTHDFALFLILRFISYFGLVSEFAVSTVLIVEFFPKRMASWGMSLLYILGVLGGVSATFMDFISWQYMFVFGGMCGLVIFFLRGLIHESPIFIEKYQNENMLAFIPSLKILFTKCYKPLLYNFLLTLPYFFIISVMFSMVMFISPAEVFSKVINIFLIGFFCGNIISCITSGIYNQFFSNPKLFFVVNLLIFIFSILLYKLVKVEHIYIYGVIIGFIGGGYNIMWAQHAAAEFPVEVRALATNIIYALGRASTIIFGSIIGIIITSASLFQIGLYSLTIVLFIIAMLVALFYNRVNVLE